MRILERLEGGQQVERVALRVAMQALGQGGKGGGGWIACRVVGVLPARDVCYQIGDLCRVERVERYHIQCALCLQAPLYAQQGRGGRRHAGSGRLRQILGSIGSEQQDRLLPQVTGEVMKEVQSRWSGPVQVVDDQRQRLAPRKRDEELADALQ